MQTKLKKDYFHNKLKAFQEFSKKLVKNFNGTAMSTFFVLPSTGIFPVTFTLDLNDFEFLIATSPSTDSSLY